MEQFVSDLRDIVLGIAHALAALVHLIGWIISAIGWIFNHWAWILGAVAIVVLGYHALIALEGRDIMALFKRKPAELEPATASTVARADTEAQRAATDLVWAVREGDVARINEALKRVNRTNTHLTAEITETDTHTVTVKKRMVVG